MITIGPWWTPARERHRRRPRRERRRPPAARKSAATAAPAEAPVRPSSPPSSRVREAQPREDARARAPGEQPRGGEERHSRAERRLHAGHDRRAAITSAELERPSGSASPARLVVEHPVVDEHVEGDARRRPSAPRSRPATSGAARARARRRRRAAPSAASSRESIRPSQRVRHALHPPQEAVRRVLRARPACRPPGSAHCAATPGERERPLAVRERRHGAVGRERDPARRASRARAPRRARASSGSCAEPAPEAGRADHLLRAVHLGRDPEPRAGLLDRLVPRPAGRVGRREQRRAGSPRARPAPCAWKRGEPAAREERPRHVERPPHRLAAAHRRHPRARRRARSATRSPPPSPRRRRRRRRRTRAARRRGLPAGRRRAPRARSARDGRWRRARAGTCPAPSSSNPPSTARIRSIRLLDDRGVPADPRAQLARRARGTRRRSGGSGRRRSATSGQGLRRAECRPHREPGKRGREAVTVALRAHPPLADRRGAAAPRRRRVGARRSKTVIVLGATPPWRSVA